MDSNEKIDLKDIVWADEHEHENQNIFTIASKPLHIEIKQSDWCGYEGECKKDMANIVDLCVFCKYKKDLDMPAILDEAHEKEGV